MRLAALLALLLMASACSASVETATPTSTTTSASTTTSTGVDPSTPTVPGTVVVTTAPPPTTSTTTTIPVPRFVDANGFDDHTVPVIDSTLEYFALARESTAGTSVVKFNIPNMLVDANVNWADSNFYSLHDQWYSFRLLNGQRVPAIGAQPISGLRFDTVEAMNAWAIAQGQGGLPAGFRLVPSHQTGGTRFYAPGFYVAALDSNPRNYGVGSLIHMPTSAGGGGERWLIELEYSDDPSPAEIALFFERLSATLPPDIGDNLEWVVRSTNQDDTARRMAATELPYHDRIVRYSELVEAGDVQVYNEGIAAGRLLLIDGETTSLTDARAGDILLVEDVPDYLPPGVALLSSAPQTPLAHVNLLARNRGIPNASQAGLLDDPGLRQAARVRAHAVVRASADDGLDIVLISAAEYDAWASRVREAPISVPAVDLDEIDTVLDLTELGSTVASDADIEALRPIIGGKSAGFLTLLAADGVTTPPTPLALTVKPYFEHLESVDAELEAMLADFDFRTSARARYLLLEGREDYDAAYPEAADAEFADAMIVREPPSSPIGRIHAADGFVNLFRDQPLRRSTLAEIRAALDATFGDYSATQGIRFRSSSSIEDIEGFNGAGLYDSNTGFLFPERQAESDRKKTIERTVKKTWASYWGFEAVEERLLERVDHRSGGMAVLVHARFDDALERNNGVATYTILPPSPFSNPERYRAVATVNAQLGAESVTNPDPALGALPEVVQVRVTSSDELVIDRVSSSTIAPGEEILDDVAIAELIGQIRSATELWLGRVNADLDPPQRRTSLTLDFEFKTVEPGWPANGQDEAGRLVVKQARSLAPGLRGIANSVRILPIPHDVLEQAQEIRAIECGRGEQRRTVGLEVFTEALGDPDFGYSDTPLRIDLDSHDGADCVESVLFESPDRYLDGLVRNGDRLNVTAQR